MPVELWFPSGTSTLLANFSLWFLRPSSRRCKRSSTAELYPLPRARSHADFPLRGFVKCGYCTEPLTGSWSKGRNRYYGYYHCQDGCTRATKDAMAGQFEEFVRQLQPNAGYMRLYREIVLDVWRKK